METQVIEVIDLSDIESEEIFYCKCTEAELLAFTLASEAEMQTSEIVASPTLSFASPPLVIPPLVIPPPVIPPIVIVRALPAIPSRLRMRAYQRRWQARAREARRESRDFHRQNPRRSNRIASFHSI